MPSPEFRASRRRALSETVGRPILLVGSGVRMRNLPMTHLPFRQDSTFLYFTGCTAPNAALLLAHGQETLFLPEHSASDALWHGQVESLADTAGKLGFSDVRPVGALAEACAPHKGKLVSLPVPDVRRTELARKLTGQPLEFGLLHGDSRLVDSVIALRRVLAPEEHAEMRAAARITGAAHRAVMAATRPGRHERELRALFEGVLTAAGLTSAYHPILTVRGEVLHNFHATNRLEAGQLLLLDGGAEATSGYATDVTRTWPVDGRFSARQRAAYDAVLAAEMTAIEQVRAGVRYRDVHLAACRVLARWLADEGILTCDPDLAVEAGAHALFLPHGVGHLIGLDVHDLENFGDQAAYAPGRKRSSQFGTGYLRLDLDLEPGMVVTIEPGFYIVPAILNDASLTERFAKMVDLDRARSWMGFGGIRIEDDVAVTTAAADVLTGDIPKDPTELEALIGTGDLTIPSGLEALA
jgi:Xaa-Pro aminopeptidase